MSWSQKIDIKEIKLTENSVRIDFKKPVRVENYQELHIVVSGIDLKKGSIVYFLGKKKTGE